MTILDIWNLLSQGGLAAALLFALEGGRRGWYVWRRHYDDKIKEIEVLQKDNEFWRNYTLRLLSVASKTTTIAEDKLISNRGE